MIAIREAYRAGLLAHSHWARNAIAGVIVGVVALPLAMAFAIASGAKPEHGLYTAIVAGALVSLFGGSRFQIAGPTGAFVVILAAIVARHGFDGLQLATLMAGVILLAMGLTNVGGLIKFIPTPVIVGFTAGIAVIIWVGQWQYFFGLPPIAAVHFHQKLWHLLQALPQLHIPTTMLALFSLLVAVATPRVSGLARVPGPLVAMVAATVSQALFRFDGVATIGSAFGDIPQTLPSLSLPEISFTRMIELAGPAFTIAMLGAIESLLSAVVADGMAGTKHDSNQELIGQGIANMAVPLIGGFAATGAIARTATNLRNGATGPLAGLMHVFTLVVLMAALAPLARHVPLAALAAILFVVAFHMAETHRFWMLARRAPRTDVAILLVTFVLTVVTDLVVAVNVGVIIAVLHFMRRMAMAVKIERSDTGASQELSAQGLASLPSGVTVYSIDGPFFFGAVESFERALTHTHTLPQAVIIRLARVPFVDATALQSLDEAIRKLRQQHVRVFLCEANERVRTKLTRSGTLALIGTDAYADDFIDVAAQVCDAMRMHRP